MFVVLQDLGRNKTSDRRFREMFAKMSHLYSKVIAFKKGFLISLNMTANEFLYLNLCNFTIFFFHVQIDTTTNLLLEAVGSCSLDNVKPLESETSNNTQGHPQTAPIP